MIIQLTRRMNHDPKNPDAAKVWVNTDHIVMIRRRIDGYGQNLQTDITLVNVSHDIEVVEHPDTILEKAGSL